MLCLELEAPFAACRTFTAGWYRPTATFLTPSAAYGLLLNIAGIDSRLREEDPRHGAKVPASLTADGLPAVRLALGIPASGRSLDDVHPRVQTIYQQLHNYPVGKDAGIDPALTHGSKNNISPVRREFLSGVRALICLDGNEELEGRVRRGLAGELEGPRYGLPFLGDNQFLPDRLCEVPLPLAEQYRAYWYERVGEGTSGGPRARMTRFTILIDRADLSRTTSALFAPMPEATTEPPANAWTSINPPALPPPPAPKPRRGRTQ
jgi:CRISPR-associated protein Cas5t